jgi:ABC-type antimicrobial peptide transport system permease subunit
MNISYILRRFLRQKFTTALHVTGLTMGITVCLLIGLFIKYETSFDTYESKADRTYRVNQVWVDFGEKTFHYSTPFPLADAIRAEVPGVEMVTKVHHPFQSIIELSPAKRFKQDRVMMTDPEFLDVFDVKIKEGNAYEALRKPYEAVLTETTARKFFGSEDPLGKTFIFNDSFNITVGAVIADFPDNTHLPASVLLSFADNENYLMTSRTHYGSVSGGSTFIVLPEGTKPGSGLHAALKSVYDQHLNGREKMPKGSYADMEVQPLRDVHFNAKYAGGGQWVKAINTSWLWFFGSVGLAVLILACINFINLSTAQALTRAKEIGVRKSIGAGRARLILQFLTEALVLVVFSAMLALIIVKLALPFVNQLADKKLSLSITHSPFLLMALLAGLILTALMAGIYPAWVITRFRPAATLKAGVVTANPESSWLRKALVITQFSISVCLLIGLMLIGRQMDYLRNKNLGFDKDNVIVLRLPREKTKEKNTLLMNELNAIKSIKGTSVSTSPPSGGDNAHWGTLMSTIGPDDPNRKEVTVILTDDKFCDLYNLHLKAGRFVNTADTGLISETLPIARSVVNEKLVTALGFRSPEEALGKRFWMGINGWHAEITGVVADFNIGSLREEIKPTLITQSAVEANKMNIKIIAGADVPVTISMVNKAFTKVYPKGMFEFSFLDQDLDTLYKSETRLYGLFKIFFVVAMLISCLGLWGLITFAAQQRVKEIGIRKVLGASVMNIVSLLTKDFVILVGVAIAIAAPLAYWAVNRWLQDFAFRINIGWSVFVIAGTIAIAIALMTISVQAIKAAVANPVKSLRSE